MITACLRVDASGEKCVTTPTQSEVTLEESGRTWDQLTGQIDAFVAAWEAEGAAPTLAAFVPEAPQGLRHLVLVELIKVDLDYRWSRPLNLRRLEDYLREFPELERAGVPAALLYEEFHIRKRSGDAVCPEEFLARFPKQAAELARLLHLQEPEQSLSLSRPGKELAGIEAGQQLDDFDLLAALGQGAFARVFLARAALDAAAGRSEGLDRGAGRGQGRGGPDTGPTRSSADRARLRSTAAARTKPALAVHAVSPWRRPAQGHRPAATDPERRSARVSGCCAYWIRSCGAGARSRPPARRCGASWHA